MKNYIIIFVVFFVSINASIAQHVPKEIVGITKFKPVEAIATNDSTTIYKINKIKIKSEGKLKYKEKGAKFDVPHFLNFLTFEGKNKKNIYKFSDGKTYFIIEVSFDNLKGNDIFSTPYKLLSKEIQHGFEEYLTDINTEQYCGVYHCNQYAIRYFNVHKDIVSVYDYAIKSIKPKKRLGK
jgi:hypothetical protein